MNTTALAPAPLAIIAWPLGGGLLAQLRPMTRDDGPAEQRFFDGLSLDSRHQRFHIGLRTLSPTLLALLTNVDATWHRAWVVEVPGPGGMQLLADARYVRDPAQPTRAEFALAVADAWQGRGLGRRLIAHLIDDARRAGVIELFGEVLAENRRMLALAREFGMRLQAHPDGAQLVRVVWRQQSAA
jgi:GNAT superfamily N-acetyltransferase